MEKNCLFNKYAGTSSNQNLLKYGEFVFNVDVKNDITVPFSITSTEYMDVWIEGNGHFYKGTYDSQTDVTTRIEHVKTTGGYRVSAGKSTIHFTGKYGITDLIMSNTYTNRLNNISIDLNELYSIPGISTISFISTAGIHYDIDINLDTINLSNLTGFTVNSNKVKGNIVNIAKAIATTSGTSIVVGYSQQPYIPELVGSIEEFAENINPAGYGVSVNIFANNYNFHGSTIDINVKVITDGSGNATIKDKDNNILATYNKSGNTWTYTT